MKLACVILLDQPQLLPHLKWCILRDTYINTCHLYYRMRLFVSSVKDD